MQQCECVLVCWQASHSDAVRVLSEQEGTVRLEVVYVSPEEEDDETSLVDDPYGFKWGNEMVLCRTVCDDSF